MGRGTEQVHPLICKVYRQQIQGCNKTDQLGLYSLTHWGRVTHICVGKLIIIGSDNGLSPDRRQAIIWTNAELLPIGPLRKYFSENLIKMQQFSLKKMHVKMSSAKWRLSCLGLNVLSGETFYRQISRSFEGATLDVIMIVLLWNLKGISAAFWVTTTSNFRTTGIV